MIAKGRGEQLGKLLVFVSRDLDTMAAASVNVERRHPEGRGQLGRRERMLYKVKP